MITSGLSCWEFLSTEVMCRCAQAALTKYHKLNGSRNISSSSGIWKFKIRESA